MAGPPACHIIEAMSRHFTLIRFEEIFDDCGKQAIESSFFVTLPPLREISMSANGKHAMLESRNMQSIF